MRFHCSSQVRLSMYPVDASEGAQEGAQPEVVPAEEHRVDAAHVLRKATSSGHQPKQHPQATAQHEGAQETLHVCGRRV